MASRTPLWAIGLVVAITFFIALAQLMLKYGLKNSSFPYVVIGMVLVVLSGITFMFALKHSELSALHPLIGLGFVWVTLASIFILHEELTPTHLCGIVIVIAGVIFIGKSGRKA